VQYGVAADCALTVVFESCMESFCMLLNQSPWWQCKCLGIVLQVYFQMFCSIKWTIRSQWPRGLRRRSAAAHLLRLWIRFPTGTWMSVSYDSCVLSGRGPYDGLIAGPEEFYRVWCFWVWSRYLGNEENMAHWGCCAKSKNQWTETLYFPYKRTKAIT